MILTRYRHRLPTDYDMGRVRDRVASRGPDWDAAAGLVFKAFVVEDRARGAAENAYGSLYLWREPAAWADFLSGPSFAAVVSAFGRPRIETWLPIAVRRGPAGRAGGLAVTERPVLRDLAAERSAEEAQARTLADEPGVVACVSGLDAAGWRLTRFVLRAPGPGGAEIAHLAAPGLAAPGLAVLSDPT